MKKLITSIFYLLMLCMMVSSCETGEETPSGVTAINQEELNQEFSANENTGTIHFYAEGDWTASVSTTDNADNSWIDINPKSGTAGSDQMVNFTIAQNTTGKERSATITIKSGDVTVTANIKQNTTFKEEWDTELEDNMVTKITAYGIKNGSNNPEWLYETTFLYKNGQLVHTVTVGSYEIYNSKVTYRQEFQYDPAVKFLISQTNETTEYLDTKITDENEKLENWLMETNGDGYVTQSIGKIYNNEILNSDVTDQFTYDNTGHLATYYFFQKNYDKDGNEIESDGPSNSTYIWNNGNLSEMRDNETNLAWMKMEYGNELNDGFFDINQLMCDGYYPQPDYTSIILNMGKTSKNLQTKYYTYYQGETSGTENASRATEASYEAIEISYHRDEKGRIYIINYKHPNGISTPNYSETTLILTYPD
ncbi:BACON domain-containing carbohydrate-binding protein [uncultured Bacteroides sp.]|uniref:BACON domain-containing protein n=1 Tax=uncultured Bacteroides sp. TaxID=162156 RepID=UPI0026111D06|nr:BACON domain-containing carbohydrate-binding protein [uncultured Bacteroides sp.]